MATYSGSICKGHGSLGHNNRDFITPNVDRTRTHLNVVYKRELLIEAYEKLFGEELSRYNGAQKRSDRKIPDYMEHIRKSKNGEKLFYETVVQIGNKYTCHVSTEEGVKASKVLDDYMRGFQIRNPNLYVFNAVLHLDEQTPHIHVDYIPVARDYKSGLQIRNSLDKALKQQGIPGTGGKQGNSTQNWQKAEREALGEAMARYGWQLAVESGLKHEKMTVSQYKATMSEIENRISSLPEQIERKTIPMSKDKVIVSSESLQALELRAKLSAIHDDAQNGLQQKIAEKMEEVDTYKNLQKDALQKEIERARWEITIEKERLGQLRSRAERESMRAYYECQKADTAIRDNPKLQKENLELRRALVDLTAENASLKVQLEELKEKANQRIVEIKNEVELKLEALNSKWIKALDHAYGIIRDICKATGMLKYDTQKGYRVEGLTCQQSRLIEAIANYGSREAKKVGYKNIAEDINRHVTISDGIKSEEKRLISRGERDR